MKLIEQLITLVTTYCIPVSNRSVKEDIRLEELSTEVHQFIRRMQEYDLVISTRIRSISVPSQFYTLLIEMAKQTTPSRRTLAYSICGLFLAICLYFVALIYLPSFDLRYQVRDLIAATIIKAIDGTQETSSTNDLSTLDSYFASRGAPPLTKLLQRYKISSIMTYEVHEWDGLHISFVATILNGYKLFIFAIPPHGLVGIPLDRKIFSGRISPSDTLEVNVNSNKKSFSYLMWLEEGILIVVASDSGMSYLERLLGLGR